MGTPLTCAFTHPISLRDTPLKVLLLADADLWFVDTPNLLGLAAAVFGNMCGAGCGCVMAWQPLDKRLQWSVAIIWPLLQNGCVPFTRAAPIW